MTTISFVNIFNIIIVYLFRKPAEKNLEIGGTSVFQLEYMYIKKWYTCMTY